MPSFMSHVLRFGLKRIDAFGKPGDTVEEVRERAEKGARLLKPPADVRVQPVVIAGVPAEWIIPQGAAPNRALLYFHGGGWIMCSTNTHRPMVAKIARAGGIRALSVDYRLAPENPFPAGLNDCVAAYRWLLQNGYPAQNIVVGGDSAGGNLTLALLLALRAAGDPLPAAAFCFSPCTDLTGGGNSRQTKTKVDPILGRPSPINLVKSYAGEHDRSQPLISPLFGDLQGLPPILIHVGEDEILLDDATRFVEKASAAGVDAKVVIWPHMMHVFQAYSAFLPEARQSIAQIGKFIREKLT